MWQFMWNPKAVPMFGETCKAERARRECRCSVLGSCRGDGDGEAGGASNLPAPTGSVPRYSDGTFFATMPDAQHLKGDHGGMRECGVLHNDRIAERWSGVEVRLERKWQAVGSLLRQRMCGVQWPEVVRVVVWWCSGAILPLQIFEFRYRIMMHTLLQTQPLSQRSTDTTRFRSIDICKGHLLQRLARILLGSALLVATLGLGFTRPALARPSTVETSSNLVTEELDADETEVELESTSSQITKEEERDPGELVLLSYLERHPEDVKALEGLMYIRLRKGSVAKALETVENLLALRPDHAPWQFIRAQALDFLGDLEEARHAFEVILERDPLSARALQGLATVMSKAGDGAEMLEMLHRAVQTAVEAEKPKEAKNLRMLLGQMYTFEGKLQEALAQYQELEKEDPKDFRPYLCQGLVYSLLNQRADAERAFLKYRRRCPKSFPERGYLDDLMIGAKTEARKLQTEERLQPQGKKKPKPLRQPNIVTAVDNNIGLEEE